MTLSDLWHWFQGMTFFDIEYLRNDPRQSHIVTIELQQKVVWALSHGDISNDLDGSLTRFSRSRHFWSQISQIPCILQSFSRTLIGNHTKSIEWYHFQWPWVTSDQDDFKVTFFEVEYRKNGASERQSYYCTRGKYLTYGMVLCLVTLTNL